MITGRQAFEEANRAVGHHNRHTYTDDRLTCPDCNEQVRYRITFGPIAGGRHRYTRYECPTCGLTLRLSGGPPDV